MNDISQMTVVEQEAVAKFEAIEADNKELDYAKADAALCEFLRRVGYVAVVDAYELAKERIRFRPVANKPYPDIPDTHFPVTE